MSDIGAMVVELIAAGCAPEVAARVLATAFVAGANSVTFRGIPVDETAEKRRAYDRERKRKSTGIPPESTGIPISPLSKNIDKKEREKRGSRIPPEFPTAEDLEFAGTLGWSDLQIKNEAANFRDFWLGCPGAKGVKLDWPATWRKWARTSRVKPVASLTIVRPSEVDWRPIMDSYKRFKHWPKGHGNEPGMPGCRVPPELLQECGFPCPGPSDSSPTIHPKSTIVVPPTFSAMPK